METIRRGSPRVGLFNFPLDPWRDEGRFAAAGIELNAASHLTGEEYGAQIRAGAYDMGHTGIPAGGARLARVRGHRRGHLRYGICCTQGAPGSPSGANGCAP